LAVAARILSPCVLIFRRIWIPAFAGMSGVKGRVEQPVIPLGDCRQALWIPACAEMR